MSNKTAKIFISSTFRDMHAERDYLVNKVFPELRERCQQQGVYLVDVDLRWGVTEEESENDQTLKICLDEIDSSRPFFIGLLGERYGWVPEEYAVPQEPQYDWVNKFQQGEHSVTALEIIYGVLNNPKQIPYSYFYFRDSAFIMDVPEGKRLDLVDSDSTSIEKLQKLKAEIKSTYTEHSENINEYTCGYAGLRVNKKEAIKQAKVTANIDIDKITGFVADDGLIDNVEYNQLSLTEKEFIHSVSVPYVHSLETFGQEVLKDLWHAIQKEFNLSKGENLEETTEEREASYHQRFIDERTRFLVGRDDDIEDITNKCRDNGNKPLAVVGEAGSGKSALMASVVSKLKEKDDLYVIPHFVGASPDSLDIERTLYRFVNILQKRYEIAPDTEDKIENFQDVIKLFHSTLETASQKGRIVIVVDAVNQFSERNYPDSLIWIPRALPANVQFLISTLEGDVTKSIDNLQIPVYNLLPLSEQFCDEFIKGYLNIYRKRLKQEQIDKILKKDEHGKPLYLKLVCEELRVFSKHEEIDLKIDNLNETIEELFDQLFDRLEEENDPQFVKDSLCFIECSRYGLMENEILNLLQGEEETIPRLKWSPVYYSLVPYLRTPGDDKTGYTDFFHRQLSKAVRRRYLQDPEEEKKYHSLMMQYFNFQAYGTDQKLPWSGTDARGYSELPFHMIKAGEMEQTEKLLTNFEFIMGKSKVGLTQYILQDYEMYEEFSVL